ncbi:MAG TPA: DUF4956 domain-containing protein [Vicinamibacterales bacterium]|jgi:hypothetical protein|nr:DUF4956 domain-containing protein [Vicinamibacterales bacterium]
MEAFWQSMYGQGGTLLMRLALDLVFVFLVVRGVYTRLYHHRDYAFTYMLLNLVTFALSFILSQVRVDLGFAMGLFAVFGILRYRTESIEVRNLTYLFVVIGLAVLNALVTPNVSVGQLLLVNAVIVGMVAGLESAPFSRREESRRVVYDRLELLTPARAEELMADLRTRTQLPVERYEIGNVDLLRDTADLLVYYTLPTAPPSVVVPFESASISSRSGQGTVA